jgi:hypothetical protein
MRDAIAVKPWGSTFQHRPGGIDDRPVRVRFDRLQGMGCRHSGFGGQMAEHDLLSRDQGRLQ